MKLERNFYLRNANEVAIDLLGKILVHNSQGIKTSGRIVEVEAYIGPDDAASHAYRLLKSKRTAIQYGLGGYAYVYFIYGMYNCFNIVTNIEEKPEVVLIRALEPIYGIDVMLERRHTKTIKNISNGPGKLCMAMGIENKHYGADLCGNDLYLESDGYIPKKIVTTQRINIDYAGESKELPWRYYIESNIHVSKA